METKEHIKNMIKQENEKLDVISKTLDIETKLSKLSMTNLLDIDTRKLIIKAIIEGDNHHGVLSTGLGTINLCNVYYNASEFFKNASGIYDSCNYSDRNSYLIGIQKQIEGNISNLEKLLTIENDENI